MLMIRAKQENIRRDEHMRGKLKNSDMCRFAGWRHRQLPPHSSEFIKPRITCLILLCLLAGGCGKPPQTLEVIQAAGELRIAIVPATTTYYEDALGVGGFEHDLLQQFAEQLKLKARFILADDIAALERLVQNNKAHLGAALLPVTATPPRGLAFGPSYAVIHQVVVCQRNRADDIGALEDLLGQEGATVAGRGARHLMQQYLPLQQGFRWRVAPDVSPEALMASVRDGELDFAVVPSFDFAAAQGYFPELKVAMTLGQPQVVAWLYRPDPQSSLQHAQLDYLQRIRTDGTLDRITQRYFRPAEEFDYLDARALLRDYEQRLPDFREDFIAAAAATDLDWRLLAAMAYQESRWRPDARSPTGVRGLMMLTKRTARELDVDRLVPRDAILGAARYLVDLKARLPARLEEPDRTWLALAAYNIGLGHLEDARVLTQRAGLDPDRWLDVRRHLPKLGIRRWAEKTRHGFARGYQAVHFVDSTRRYLSTLRRLERKARPPGQAQQQAQSRLVSPVL